MNPLNGKRAKSSFALTILILCLLTSSFILQAFADSTLFDDQGTSFWTVENSNSGSGPSSIAATITTDTSVVHSGSSSLKQVITAGTYKTVGFYHVFSPNADWSTVTGVSFWLHGSNSGTSISFDIIDQNRNYYADLIQDNFNGWQQFTLNFATAPSVGAVDLKNISIIEFAFTSPAPPILYVDQMVLIGASTPSPSPSPSTNPSSTPTSTSSSNPTSSPSQTAFPQTTSSSPSPTQESEGSLFSPFYPTYTGTPTAAPTSTPTAAPISTSTTSSMSLLEGVCNCDHCFNRNPSADSTKTENRNMNKFFP